MISFQPKSSVLIRAVGTKDLNMNVVTSQLQVHLIIDDRY